MAQEGLGLMLLGVPQDAISQLEEDEEAPGHSAGAAEALLDRLEETVQASRDHQLGPMDSPPFHSPLRLIISWQIRKIIIKWLYFLVRRRLDD